MCRFRCALVAAGFADIGAHITRSLQGFGALDELISLSTVEALFGRKDFDAIVLIADTCSLPKVLAAVVALRKFLPDCALLIGGVDLGSSAWAALLDAGIDDFFSIAISEEELVARLHRVLGKLPEPEPETAALRALPSERFCDFIGSSPAFAKQLAKLPIVAGCDASVLIFGETGTGKEICAQAIHYLSGRAGKPWVAVNCSAIPVEMIENEMFGHVKGAYTTAHCATPGLAREAEGGTLFLDDVDCLPLSAQSKLLRFLQEREYRPVGSSTVCRADVRVIAASNERLARMVARGAFRQDLFYRLNVLTIDLPPLRERGHDIAQLARHFVRSFAAQYQRPVSDISPQVMTLLLRHGWPGNVRELKHVLERAVLLTTHRVLAAEDIDIADAGEDLPTAESFHDAKERIINQFERSFIETLLVTHGGNITNAAKAAQKNRRAFFQLMRKHCIESDFFRGDRQEERKPDY
jgi:two-component system, NtrC family, response regulator GlrR